ncbi:MAG: hypothetical protein WC641_02190 [Patescibacteria group bacterium]
MGTLVQFNPKARSRMTMACPHKPAARDEDKPDFEIRGFCLVCEQPVVQGEGGQYGADWIHAKCLIDDNLTKGWKAEQGYIFHLLADPFGKVMGMAAVRHLIDPFFYENLNYAQAFTNFVSLETLLNSTEQVAEDRRHFALRALAIAKDHLRAYLRLLK